MIPFVLVICVIVVSWCVFYSWSRRNMRVLARKIPGPRAYPIVGNALLCLGKEMDILPIMINLFYKYGSVLRLWLGHRLYIMVSSPDDAQKILSNQKIRNRDWGITKATRPFVGGGLLTLRDDQWMNHRKIINPTFHYSIMESYMEVFGRKSKILMAMLKSSEGASFNVHDTLSLYTLDSICETVLGVPSDTQVTGHSPFVKSIYDGNTLIFRRITRPWELIDTLYFAISADRHRARELIKIVQEFSESAIAHKLAEYRRGIRSPSIVTSGNKKVSSFLDMIVEASESDSKLPILTQQEIRDEVTGLFLAGLETTAFTMSLYLILIALHPEVQADIHEELDNVFGTDSRCATKDDLHQLPVMERCIKETLRLFCPVVFQPREIDEELILPSGYTVPANSSVIVCTYMLHRDATTYPEPEKFWPDRWLSQNMENMPPFAYLPYSYGPRNCVGQKYAQLQMKCVLSQVLRHYRVTTPLTMEEIQKLELSVTAALDSNLKHRYHVQLHKREGLT